jgi:flagellar assembly protein FliH
LSNKILPAGTRYSSWSLPSLIPPAVVEDAPGMLPFPEELLPPEPAPLIEPAAEELELADEAAPSATPWPSAEELEALHNQAWQEGYQAGLAAGHAKGQSSAG